MFFVTKKLYAQYIFVCNKNEKRWLLKYNMNKIVGVSKFIFVLTFIQSFYTILLYYFICCDLLRFSYKKHIKSENLIECSKGKENMLLVVEVEILYCLVQANDANEMDACLHYKEEIGWDEG